jgi:hypothetical protein
MGGSPERNCESYTDWKRCAQVPLHDKRAKAQPDEAIEESEPVPAGRLPIMEKDWTSSDRMSDRL